MGEYKTKTKQLVVYFYILAGQTLKKVRNKDIHTYIYTLEIAV